MSKIDLLSRDDAVAPAVPQRRPPPRAVKLLLPVWGHTYVRQFLEIGLPTMLAPGNVPAVAAALPTELILLTSADDAPFIQRHPVFRRLATACKTKIQPIDHLITDGNHSTTITLAYTEAVREVGAEMLETCFFFLVSDYIIADGSLANALKRMRRGTSAILTGNFQVTREDGLPWLRDRLAVSRQALALSPRVLMQWALGHLHPATLANTVNIPLSHNSHTNRLFWRVDRSTIIGRFYLMHMLCVRPEITDFIIGASCDYSFIPEMCPSGNVETITDSDEYLVIELQPRNHEATFLRPGPLNIRKLARSLSDWTTKTHRENAHHSLIFHGGELPHQLKQRIEEADAFVDDVAHRLRQPALPHRGHPYWRGAMAAFYDATGRRLSEHEWRYALGLPASEDRLTQWLLYHAKFTLMGRPPRVLPWHPFWPDFRAVLNELASFFTDRNQRLLMLSNEPTAFTVALADNGERVLRKRCVPFLESRPERFAPLYRTFDLCLIELPEADLRYGDQLIDRVVPLMKNGGSIIVSITNRRSSGDAGDFVRSVIFWSARLIRPGVWPAEIHFVPANPARWMARRGMFNLRLLMNAMPWASAPLAMGGGSLLLGLSFIGNVDTLRSTRRMREHGRASSFLMRLTVDAFEFVDGRTRHMEEMRKEASANASDGSARASTGEAREPQYDRCIELHDAVGRTALGLLTNQIWYDDPRRLTVLLARYKFVAKMLSGCGNAAEVGCGDAFATRMVLPEVPNITVYDFDSAFIDDIRARPDARWPLKAELHDIIAAPLPRKYDGIFSLDGLERVSFADEHAFLANLRGSLASEGILIIGTRSTEPQPYPSFPGKADRVNLKSGRELEALLRNYFTRVLMFSMNGDVIHNGSYPMADYLFAICTGPR